LKPQVFAIGLDGQQFVIFPAGNNNLVIQFRIACFHGVKIQLINEMNKHESLYSRGFWSNIESFPAGGFFHGNTLDHHDQIAPKNTASLAGRMDAGKGKAAAFQALVVQHEPAPFPMEQLDGRPGPVDKDEHFPA
jgi:hypothetical protein